MNVTTEQSGNVSIVRVGETRLMYPVLGDFATAVTELIAAGRREILIPPGQQRRRTAQALRRAEARRDDAHPDRGAELHRDSPRRAERRPQLRGLDMRTIKTTTGTPIALDGDLLAVMEALHQEVTARRELERSFEDMVREIQNLIDQMDDSERRTYLAESLFLNTVKYENDKLEAYMKRLSKK
jgi:hypothetical protein